MELAWLELTDFRSYRQIRWEPESGVNLLVGPNAIGKTNLLESIGYLASLRSFRKAPDAVLIRDGDARAIIRGEVKGAASSTLIEVELPRKGRRRAQVNRTRLVRLADLLGKMRCVVFLPDDLDIVKRGPRYRRELLDSVAVQIRPAAYQDQHEYDRTLRQRNVLLKQWGRQADATALDAWDERLARTGGRVIARRRSTIRAIEGAACVAYRDISGAATRLSIAYRPSWAGGAAEASDVEEALVEALRRARAKDMERRVTTVGPHRDDVALMLDHRNTRVRASQGEQRSAILSLRVAAHLAIERATGEPPILLLDDVFSELDHDRSGALAAALPEAQTFVTATSVEGVPVTGRRWYVGAGALR